MYRARRITLTTNADADALETTRAALTGASGQPVYPEGGKVTLAVTAINQAITAGNMVGFARLPETFTADGQPATWRWMRWQAGDVDCNNVNLLEVVTAPIETPIGATAVISLPLAFAATGGVTTAQLNIYYRPPQGLGV